jgi:hypothetical protein
MDGVDKKSNTSFVYITRVHEYLNKRGLRLSSDAKQPLQEYLDLKIIKAIDELIDKGIPKVTRGKRLNELKKTTITKEVIEKSSKY